MALNFLRRYQEAEAALLPALARDPQAPILLSTLRTTYHLMGRHEQAMEMWRASYQGDLEALEALEEGYRTAGYSAALRGVADLLVRRSDTTYVRPWLIGTLYTRAGLGDTAIPYLEQAFAEHDPNMPYISIDPIFDPLRREPRFRALMDRLGLPQ
jgi:tetratricopeptide (TPR) repeat protein